MPFEDKQNLTDLRTFTDEVWFNDDVRFYGNVYNLRIINNGSSSVEVDTENTVVITTNNVGIVTLSQNNIGIAKTVTLETTGIVQQLFENVNVSSTALTGTVNLDILSGSLYYYTSNPTANWTFNIRGNSVTPLNNVLPVDKSLTVTILTNQGGATHYANSFEIDGVSVTPNWMNGITPTAGFSNAINVYTFVIIKTADATYTVIGSLNRTT